MLTLCSSLLPITPRRDFAEAERISRQIGSPSGEAWVCWSLGILEIVQGRYGQALEVIRRGLEIATQIRHREWIVGNRCALGLLYLQLLAPELALKQLEPTMNLAEELGSPVWVRGTVGHLAAVYSLLGNYKQAQMLLESVLTADTLMDTMNKRYCWARRAELALCQEDAMLALDIIERLIATTPGIVPRNVISFLWKLKGEAFAALDHTEEALSLLGAAVENAESTGERFLLWQLHARLGQLYHKVGRESEAEMQFSNALKHNKELGDTMPAGALKDTFLRRSQQRLLIKW
jgi:tetratricopeptide (TPR) repeat protein